MESRARLNIIGEPKPFSAEWEAFRLINEQTIILFKNNGIPTSWLRLKEGESLAVLPPISDFLASQWMQHRVGKLSPSDETHAIVVRGDASLGLDANVIDPQQQTLTLATKKFAPYDRLEITNDPKSNTEPLCAQKTDAKRRLDALVLETIDKAKTQEGTNQPRVGIPILNTPDGHTVHLLAVTEEMIEAGYIDGDKDSQDPSFIPLPQNPRYDQSRNQVATLQNGELLIVSMICGQVTYISPNFGKTATTTSSILALPLGPQKQSITTLIKARRYTSTVEDKIKRFIVRKLISAAQSVFPAGVEYPSSTLQTLTEYLQGKVQLLQIGEEPNSVTMWLTDELFEQERTRLLSDVYPRLIEQMGLEQFILDRWNRRVAEDWMYSNLQTEPYGSESLLQIIALWEAGDILGKRALELHRTLALWRIAQDLSNVDPTTYYTGVRQLITANVASDDLLYSLASNAASQLSENQYQTIVQEITPKTPLQEALIAEISNLKGKHRILNVETRNIPALKVSDDGTLTLALELCPAYEPKNGSDGVALTINEHARPLPIKDFTEEEIMSSIVGGKWKATLGVIETLKRIAETYKLKLKVRAVFADLGVIISKEEYRDDQTICDQSTLYRNLLHQFCNQMGVELEFYDASDFEQKPDEPQVEQFCVVEQGEIINTLDTLEEFLHVLDLSRYIDTATLTERQRSEMFEVLRRRLEMSHNNLALFKTLVHSYTMLLREFLSGRLKSGAKLSHPSIHLGNEIATIFFDLTKLIRSFPQSTIPTINVQVSK